MVLRSLLIGGRGCELDNHIIICSKQFTDINYNEKDDFFFGTEVNVAIASAITSWSEIKC